MTDRVRFAPSPTGFLHVGGARTALFNWLFARSRNGAFLLRIEDTDAERSTDENVQAILDSMDWLGLEWDGNPWFQSDGFDRHRLQAMRLVEGGAAYRDFAEPGEPPRTDGRPDELFAVRFRVPEGRTEWMDMVHGEMSFDNSDLEDLVILRRDGSPTYNFAAVSDDAEMGITHVIRGDDHLSNTPKQILLYQALGHRPPEFGHVPMILGSDGRRLSKRHGATAVAEYADRGILPEAMVNFLALLGWSPGDDQEVMDLEEIRARFEMERVLKKSAVFDAQKLEWLNGQHMARASSGRLEALLLERLERTDPGGAALFSERAPSWKQGLIELLKIRHRTVNELAEKLLIYLRDPVSLDPEAVRKRWGRAPGATAEHLRALHELLSETEWTVDELEPALRGLADDLGVGAGTLIHPLRVALVGELAGPGIFETLVYVGRDRSLARIERAVEAIESGSAFAPEGSEEGS